MARKLPQMMHKMLVKELGTDFAKVTEIVQAPVPKPGPGQVLVRNKYVGINATDVNYTAGLYNPSLTPPFDVGLEGLGEVVAVGADTHVQVGQPVSYLGYGAFADYTLVPVKLVAPLPELNPHFLPFMLSGLTAAISLDKVGEIKKGDKVLITAAAGGTGQFAVQWCKNTGCEVIGTCSTDHKAHFLKSIGCDRAINYKKEDLNKVLQAEYPNGVDVVYESVGGDVFMTCLNNLAKKGRLIVIGAISGYLAGIREQKYDSNLPLTLLTKSASLRGFFMNHYRQFSAEYMMKLVALYQQGKLTSALDMGDNAPNGPFKGLQAVYAAEDYMHSSKNTGKVLVQLY